MPKVENEPASDVKESVDKPKDISNVSAEVLDHDKDNRRKTASPLTVISVVILFFISLCIVGGLILFFREDMMNGHQGTIVSVRESTPRMSQMFARETIIQDSSSTSQSVASGVVTSVNGTSFVVGGNGSKVTVNTSGSTTWNTTDKKVSVNDSVVVTGTESNSTITATSVRITNQ